MGADITCDGCGSGINLSRDELYCSDCLKEKDKEIANLESEIIDLKDEIRSLSDGK